MPDLSSVLSVQLKVGVWFADGELGLVERFVGADGAVVSSVMITPPELLTPAATRDPLMTDPENRPDAMDELSVTESQLLPPSVDSMMSLSPRMKRWSSSEGLLTTWYQLVDPMDASVQVSPPSVVETIVPLPPTAQPVCSSERKWISKRTSDDPLVCSVKDVMVAAELCLSSPLAPETQKVPEAPTCTP